VDQILGLLARLRADQERTDATRKELHTAILDALHAGVRQADIARATGYSRERLRQLARKAD
jgi:hypothetical protein